MYAPQCHVLRALPAFLTKNQTARQFLLKFRSTKFNEELFRAVEQLHAYRWTYGHSDFIAYFARKGMRLKSR